MKFRRIINAIKAGIKAVVIFCMFVVFIGMVSAVMADIMVDHRIGEIWEELDMYYEAKYESDKAELEYRYGIRSMEEDHWDNEDEKINI